MQRDDPLRRCPLQSDGFTVGDGEGDHWTISAL